MYAQLRYYVSCCWFGVAINSNKQPIDKAVEEAPLAGNIDDPEGSLDALMQVTIRLLYVQEVLTHFYVVSYFKKRWIKTSWTCCTHIAVLL